MAMLLVSCLRGRTAPLLGATKLGATRWLRTSAQTLDPMPKPVPLSKLKDSFNDATSVTYLEELEKRFHEDPKSVDRSWAAFFTNMDRGVSGEAIAESYDAFEKGKISSPMTHASLSSQTIQESMRLMLLIRSFQVLGHFAAELDPLHLDKRPPPAELDPTYWGFTEADLDREFFLGNWNTAGFLEEGRPVRTLREILTRLKETYCGSVGFEYMHIPEREKCNWIRERIETVEPFAFTKKEKLNILDRLAWSDLFETFLANKYTAAKRFGLEGAESLIPGMKALIDRAADLGVDNIVIGMPHRGRLNVLANVVRKPMSQIFCEFSGTPGGKEAGVYLGSGDVKYHLGTSYSRPTTSGKQVYLSLVANPSHLEAVNTVVLGKTRAKQHYTKDDDRTRAMPILLHGDGAFAGQGIVYETLDMSGLTDYTAGGCVHLVVNNQVAFTTDPRDGRSSPYCTDVAKSISAPIFHVNGDDVEAVVRVCQLAAEWRQAWKGDVVVDLVCYRKHGHNEIDEPMFTQPMMYKAIKTHKNSHKQYVDQLLTEGSVTQEEVGSIHAKIQGILDAEFEASKSYKPVKKDCSQQGTRAADATATTAGLAGLPKFACNGQGQSAADLLRAFLAIQTHRAELYATFHTGFKRFLETRQEAQYNQLLKHLTALFSACSQRVIELEAQLKVGGHAEYAGMLRTVQEGERDKLRLTLSLQALKQAHAFKSFSWQQEGADTGIGGSAHEACCHHHHHAMQALSISSNNDISTSTSRGTTAAPAPDAHQQADCHHDHDQQPGHSHSTHEHGHGHGHGHCHGGHEHSACGTAAAAAAAAAASEPTEWEYNAAVAEATRDLNSAIVAINDALEEVRYALAEEEEQQEQGPADGMES